MISSKQLTPNLLIDLKKCTSKPFLTDKRNSSSTVNLNGESVLKWFGSVMIVKYCSYIYTIEVQSELWKIMLYVVNVLKYK